MYKPVIFAIVLLSSSAIVYAQSKPKDPPPSGLKSICVIQHETMSPAEQVLAQTLQGITGRVKPKILLRAKSSYAIVEDQLRREGVKIDEAKSVWELVSKFRGEIKEMIVYKLGTPSLNVAASLSGVMNAVAVDESLLSIAEAAGLKQLEDVRGMDEKQAWEKWGPQFSKGIAIEEALDKPGFMRDYSAAHKAFTFYGVDSAFRTKIARAVGPNAIVYGWGPDEIGWVSDLSRANATGGPSDWAINMSVLEKLPAGPLHQPACPAVKVEDGVRYVAFVLTDGDNLQWMLSNFIDNKSFWANPLRGSFPITWEVSALLPKVAPRVLQYVYATAKPTDDFVTGAAGPGYTYAHLQTDRPTLARETAALCKQADLAIVGVLNTNEGNMEETFPMLDQPEVKAVLYKDYAPYHRQHGKILWHNGKPCIAFRCALWEGLMEPQDVADDIAKMPTSPKTDPQSFALVTVHAWSYGKSGGPIDAVKRTIDLLPKNTRVVNATTLIRLLSECKR